MADTPSPPLSATLAGEAALDEATETLKRTGDSLNHITNEAASCCSDTMAAAIESSTEVSRRVRELGESVFDAYWRAVATFADLGREALTCRTPADAAALQKKGFEAATSTFSACAKFNDGLFNVWSEALVPIVARATDAPERMFFAIAD